MEDKKVYYTNSIGIETSPFDVKLKMTYTSAKSPTEAEVKDLCEVVMSPEHAKVFLNVFTKVISDYEEKFGEIRTLNKN